MSGRAARWAVAGLFLGAVACGGGDGTGEAGDADTLEIGLPEGAEVEDRLEQGARRIGGRVGEALEETGQAIERAGERVQEEVGDTLAP